MAKEMWLDFTSHDIEVIRLGLHAGEDLSDGDSILAGPFHPAFGELVQQDIFREQVDLGLQELGLNKRRPNLYIGCCPRDMSALIGQHRSNIHYWQEKWGFAHIKIYPDSNLARGNVVLGADENTGSAYYRSDFVQRRKSWRN